MSLRRSSLFSVSCVFLILSCGTNSKKDKNAHLQKGNNQEQIVSDTNGDGSYRSKISFSPGARYEYTIANESETELEVNGKEVNVLHKSDVAVTYDIQKDSAGNYLLKMHYDNIHLYSKTTDKETEFDAANPAATLDPLRKCWAI